MYLILRFPPICYHPSKHVHASLLKSRAVPHICSSLIILYTNMLATATLFVILIWISFWVALMPRPNLIGPRLFKTLRHKRTTIPFNLKESLHKRTKIPLYMYPSSVHEDPSQLTHLCPMDPCLILLIQLEIIIT